MSVSLVLTALAIRYQHQQCEQGVVGNKLMFAHSIFHYTFSIKAVISAIMVTVSKNTVHSVFFLILDFISISCLFIMIGAEFLGMIMLIVYVGDKAFQVHHREEGLDSKTRGV